MAVMTEGWTPAVRCDLTDGPHAFFGAVKRFREWAAEQELKPLSLTTGWHTITPQLAEQLLLRNRHNRKLRFNDVVRYAQQMLNRRWKKTGEPVIITDRGVIEDSGHRLMACYFSGASFDTFVVADVPHDDQLFAYIDNGVSRTAEDTLTCAGLNGLSSAVSSIIKEFALRYEEGTLVWAGRVPTMSPITNIDVLNYANNNPEIGRWVHRVKDNFPAAIKRLTDLKIAAFVAWKIAEARGVVEAEEYLNELTQTDLPAGHAVAALQKRLDEHVAAAEAAKSSPKRRMHLTSVQIVFLALRAFTLSRSGVSVKTIMPRADDRFPIIEPATETAEPITEAAE